MQRNTHFNQNQNASLLPMFGSAFYPQKPKTVIMSKPLIEVHDYHVNEDDCSVKLECQWGADEFEINVSPRLAEQWANETNKLTKEYFDYSTDKIEFEPYMIVEFNFTQAHELAAWIIKNHFELITKSN